MRYALPLLLFGCAPPDAEPEDSAPADDGPEAGIRVSPDPVVFGDVHVGEAAVATVTVSSTGDAALEIYDLELEDPELNDSYAISAIGAVLVPPGSSTTFVVTFAPEAEGLRDTRLRLESNAPDDPTWLAVTATGLPRVLTPELVISPSAHDFGSLRLGCEEELPLTLTNTGAADLVVTDLAYASSGSGLTFEADEAVNGALPWTLAPGAGVDVHVTYAPLEQGAESGVLTVTSDDPDGAVLATQTGTGRRDNTLDTFRVPPSGTVDVVVVVDMSLAARAPSGVFEDLAELTERIDAAGLDYQLGIALADDGCIAGDVPFVDAAMTPDERLTHLQAMEEADAGAYMEMGFTVLEAATSSTNVGVGGCNEGLLRTDAALHLLGITDEVEQSADPWSTYVSRFEGLKAESWWLGIHAIAGDYPSGCGGSEPGQGWYEASVSTGGQFLSVCERDWSSHLDALVAAFSTEERDSFELSEWPVPWTIEVSVDGVALATGWTYAEGDRTVSFDEGALPAGGYELLIEYATYGDCGE